MEEKAGIKEITEAIDAIALIAKAGLKVAADSKVDLADLTVLIDLAKQGGLILEGIKDADKIPAEIKDLDIEEAKALLLMLFAKFTEAKAA